MKPLRVEAIIFDFDGVLVESVNVKGQAFADLFAEFGPEFQKRVLDFHYQHGGVSRFEKFREYYRWLGKILSSDAEKTLGQRFCSLVLEAVVNSPWVDGAKEFLENFHSRLPLFIASGTPEEELREIIRRRDMGRFFKGSFGSPASKAEIVKRIVQAHGFSPHRVLMVGDALSDMEGARANEVCFLGRIPAGSRSPLEGEKIDWVPDLRSLPGILENAE